MPIHVIGPTQAANGLTVTNPPGTSGQYLKANGDGTFTWTSFATVTVYDGGTP